MYGCCLHNYHIVTDLFVPLEVPGITPKTALTALLLLLRPSFACLSYPLTSGMPTSLWELGDPPLTHCSVVPHVALLFLLTTHPPPESAWKPWLEASHSMMASSTGCPPTAGNVFRVHTHSSPTLKPELGIPGSIFDGSEIPTRIPTAWGHHNCTVAFQNLLKHALQVRGPCGTLQGPCTPPNPNSTPIRTSLSCCPILMCPCTHRGSCTSSSCMSSPAAEWIAAHSSLGKTQNIMNSGLPPPWPTRLGLRECTGARAFSGLR